MFRLSLPGWLVTLIASLAAYLKGASDQRARDEQQAENVDAADKRTAAEKRAEAEALDHDALRQEEDRWTAP